jgi:hypothetical protein
LSDRSAIRTTTRHLRACAQWARLAALALGASLALYACTGPGLEPPNSASGGDSPLAGTTASGRGGGGGAGAGGAGAMVASGRGGDASGAGTGGSPAGASGAGGAGGEVIDAGVDGGLDEDGGALH